MLLVELSEARTMRWEKLVSMLANLNLFNWLRRYSTVKPMLTANPATRTRSYKQKIQRKLLYAEF